MQCVGSCLSHSVFLVIQYFQLSAATKTHCHGMRPLVLKVGADQVGTARKPSMPDLYGYK